MARRVIDPRLFWAESALLNWAQIHELHEYAPVEGFEPSREWAFRQVALRWHVYAGTSDRRVHRPIGLPTGPFTVWRRPVGVEARIEQPIDLAEKGFVNGLRVVAFRRPVATVTLHVTSAAGGAVFGLSHEPRLLSFVTWETVAGGNRVVRLRAGHLNGVAVPPGMVVTGAEGSDPHEFVERARWEPVEIVGYPVDRTWAGVGGHLTRQGLVGDLTDPIEAARRRIARGTPPLGWHAVVGNGASAPPWVAPQPDGLIDEVSKDLLPELRQALRQPQDAQASHVFTRHMPSPESIDGKAVPGPGSEADIPSVGMLQMAVAGDPFLSLTLGFGTNLTDGDVTNPEHIDAGSVSDYMVTAPYADGFGDGREIELTTLALQPKNVLPPPLAAGLASVPRAYLPPSGPDAPWRASTTTRWDRPFGIALARPASHAVTRHDPGEAESALQLQERPSGGHHPIAPARGGDDDLGNFVIYADRHFPVANDPGHRTLHYGVANQNIFGIWSAWTSSTVVALQPAPAPPRILAARLDVTAPASGSSCAASVTLDVTWDWTDRRPGALRLVGRMFAAPDRSTTDPSPGVPAGLDRAVATPGAAVRLEFTGDTPTLVGAAPGSTVEGVDPQGETTVAFGAAQGGSARRYRVRLTGFMCDFAATDHIGLGLWISGSERIAPQRVATAPAAFHTYASTPIAPAVPPELVPLSSLPDAEGRSHVRVTWPAAPGADAYVIYGSDEITMRDFYELGEPDIAATLSDRVTELLDAWEGDPNRRPFTRLTPRPVTGTSAALALPRGTTGIATFVVIAMSAGGTEGPWPQAGSAGLRDAVVVRATPRIAAPATPAIEARVQDGTVHLTVRTRPGHRVGRVDVHRVRVDEAARALDLMGPPIATVTPATAGWSVQTDDDGAPLEFTGTDTPSPSWRRVWYRAAAWADDQWPVDGEPFPYQIAERGLIAGRSAPSNVVSVTVPPPNPPDLSPVVVSWPGGGAADVELTWTTTAPFEAPLGIHRTDVDVRVSGSQHPLADFHGPLGDVSTTAPLGDGVFRDPGSTPAAFHAIVRRSDATAALDASVRVVDPLGRATERSVHVPAGPVLPAPHLGSLDVFTIVGRGTILTFVSSSPTVWFDGGQAYELTVEAIPPSTRPPVFPLATGALATARPRIRPGRLTPSRHRVSEIGAVNVIDTSGVAVRGIGDLLAPSRPVTLTTALPDIPIDRNQSATGAPIEVRRSRASGDHVPYSVLVTTDVRAIRLTLRSPDGRVTTASKEVS